MASFDYSRTVATVQTLLAKFGRQVTLLAFDDTLEDAAKPWKGPAAASARSSPSLSDTRYVVQAEPSSLQKLGLSATFMDLVARADLALIVEPGSTALTSFSTVLDGSTYYNIEGVETLKPADTEVLGFLAVSR